MLPKEVREVGNGLIEPKEDFLQQILVLDDINNTYEVEKDPFARGNFGTVRRAIHKKTGVKYAAKFLRRRRRALCWAKQINHEIAVLMLSKDSKQIVKLHAVYETKTETALILELAAGGELQAILDEDGSISEEKTRICIREVLKALEYLHRRHVAHLDIKPQNILLITDNLEDGLKLCDFGFSRAVQGNNVCEIQGTPDYVAPEILQYEPLSLNTDIWSVGVLTYALLTGCSPFGGDNKQETFLNISKCNLTFPEELFEDISDDAIDFIKSVLRIKPRDRLDVFECLNHKWLKEDSPINTLSSLMSQEEQTTIELHKNKRNTLDICTSDVNVTIVVCDDDDDEKENSLKMMSATTIITCDQEKEKDMILCQLENINGTTVVKTVLEKSATVNFPIFPDAPTTPKVCRKAPYDDAEVKQIVKKYQAIENNSSPCVNGTSTNNSDKILIEDSFCCSTFSCCKSLDCLVCKPENHLHAKKSLEIDKGIIC